MQQQQQQPIMGTGAVVIEQDNCALPWRRATVIANIFATIAVCLLVLGLVLKTVLYVDVSIGPIDFEVHVSYYGAKVHHGNPDYSLNDATCSRGSLVRFAGALHYFAFFSSIVLASALGAEVKNRTYKGHVVLGAFVTTCSLLLLMNACLAIVRGHANYTTCNTVLAGLERYGVGSCWGCAIGAYVILFWSGVAYICSRYMKCCCYTPVGAATVVYQQAPAVGGYQQQPVAGQPVAYQQQPAYQQQQQAPQQQPVVYQQQPEQQGYQQQGGYDQAPPQKTV